MITSPDLSEELRLAVVMNGGVSLAVWIGGVTFELGRLIAGSGSYAELCSLTAAVPRVDVIAGTSAGGINGAFLAMAMANHAGPSLETQLRALRNLWVCNGSFDDLLRGPFVRDPPSLLDGDGYFLPILRDALQALRSNGPAKQELPIELFITTTLLQGRENRQSDDFGVPITDVDHRAVFHFSRDPGSGRRDDFVDPLVGDKLALAARCTSSFPAAFEPSYCPVNAEDATDTRPSMEGIADFKSGFVLDGGILDNKPLDLALERIFLQRSAGPARRMLVYVVPDPGGTAAPSIARKDIGEPPSSPGMLEIMIDSLVRIPNVQSVSAQLAALRNHNTRVRERRQARVLLTRYNNPEFIDQLSTELFAAYRAQRLETAVGYVIGKIEGALIEHNGVGFAHRGRREWIHGFICSRHDMLPWLPQTAPLVKGGTSEQSVKAWRWGTRPVEHSARVLLDILGRCQRIARQLPNVDVALFNSYLGVAYDVLDSSRRLRGIDDDHWTAQGELVLKFLGGGSGAPAPDEAAKAWLDDAILKWIAGIEASAQVIGQIADVLLAMREGIDVLRRAMESVGAASARDAARRREEWESLNTLFSYFVRNEDSSAAIVARLLAFEVVQEALGGRGTLPEEEVDFVQISGEGASEFGGATRPSDKLSGVQLAHFGAFYKASWRANDWMWGRLDAVRRLVRILLDPERIRIVSMHLPLGTRAAAMTDALVRIATGGDAAAAKELTGRLDRSTLVAELRYLDQPDSVSPEYLAAAVSAVSRRLELEILCEELPLIARAADVDARQGARVDAAALHFRGAFPTDVPDIQLHPSQVQDVLGKCAIGRERLEAEIGTDRLTKISAQTAALAVAAVSRQTGWLESMGNVLALLRAPTLLFYLFARNAETASAAGLAANIAIFVAGAAVATTGAIFASDYPNWLLVAGWVAFAIGGAFLVVKLPRFVRILLVALAVLTIGAAAGRALSVPDRSSRIWPALAFVEFVLLAWFLLGRVLIRSLPVKPVEAAPERRASPFRRLLGRRQASTGKR